MALRFTLLEKTGLEGDKVVKAPGLRRWHRSKPGVGSLALPPGRAQPRPRTPATGPRSTSAGTRLRAAERASARSGARSLPPVRTRSPTSSRSSPMCAERRCPGVMRYGVLVSNSGRSRRVAAAPVRLTVDGDVVDTRLALRWRPHERRTRRDPRTQACTRLGARRGRPRRSHRRVLRGRQRTRAALRRSGRALSKR